MAVFALEDIIKSVDKKIDVTPGGVEKFLAINEKTREVTEKPSLFSWGTRYFLVRNRNDEKHVARSPGVIVQIGQPGFLQLDLQIGYEAYCEEGNEERLLRALYDTKEKPSEVLERNLRHWVREFALQLSQAELSETKAFKERLSAYLTHKSSAFGLTFIPGITIKQENAPASFHLKDLRFSAKLRDARVSLDVMIDLDLIVDHQRKHLYLARQTSSKQIAEIVLTQGRRYFTEEVSLYDYYYGRNAWVKEAFIQSLQPELYQCGLTLASLKINGKKPPLRAGFELILDVTRELHVGRQQNFRILPVAKLRISLKDIARFEVANLQENAIRPLVEKEVGNLFEGMFKRAEDQDLMERDGFRNELAVKLPKRLSAYGLDIELLHFDLSYPDIVIRKDFSSEIIPISVDLPPRKEPITINFRVSMSLEDESCYLLAGHPTLSKWAHAQLGQVINKVLFHYDFTRVVLDFEEEARPSIEDMIRKAAKAIGYRLDLLVISPELKPLKWRESFLLQSEDMTFQTKVPNLSVQIAVYARMRIKNLRSEKIQSYIRDEEDIHAKIRDALHEHLLPYFHELDPQRFYLGFEIELPPHLQAIPSKKPLPPAKKDLERLVRQILKERFEASVESLTIKQQHTDLSTRLENLLKQRAEFSFPLESFKGHQTITFSGTLRVTGVDANGWDIFVSSDEFGIDEIVRRVTRFLGHRSTTISERALAFIDSDTHADLTEIFEEQINEATRSQFGICVALVDFGREKTQLEKARAEKLGKREFLELERFEHDLEENQKHLLTAAKVAQIGRENDLKQIGNLQKEIADARHDGCEDEAIDLEEQLTKITNRYHTPDLDVIHSKLLEQHPKAGVEDVKAELASFRSNRPRTGGLPRRVSSAPSEYQRIEASEEPDNDQ